MLRLRVVLYALLGVAAHETKYFKTSQEAYSNVVDLTLPYLTAKDTIDNDGGKPSNENIQAWKKMLETRQALYKKKHKG